MGKNMDWIYRPINEPDLENTLEAVEKALGFKLFVWQKTFYCHGCISAVRSHNGEDITGIVGGGCTAIGLHHKTRQSHGSVLPRRVIENQRKVGCRRSTHKESGNVPAAVTGVHERI